MKMNAVWVIIYGIFLLNVTLLEGRHSTWRYTTACYGSDPACSGYQIECGIGERIVIGALKYGGKSNPNDCQFGIANCQKTLTIQNVTKSLDKWCCTFDPRDYLKDFNKENRTAVVNNCNGQQKCSGRVPRIFDISYSSYVWMQYTCIKDNYIEMCENNNKSGLDVFVTFNLSQGYSFPSLNGSRDCACQVRARDCTTKLELRVVSLNLSQAGLANNQQCSSAYLDLTPSDKFSCGLKNSLDLPAVYTNVSWSNTIALRHLFLNGSTDRPSSVIVSVKADEPRSPITVECYQPGVEPPQNKRCKSSTTSVTLTAPTPSVTSAWTSVPSSNHKSDSTPPIFSPLDSSISSATARTSTLNPIQTLTPLVNHDLNSTIPVSPAPESTLAETTSSSSLEVTATRSDLHPAQSSVTVTLDTATVGSSSTTSNQNVSSGYISYSTETGNEEVTTETTANELSTKPPPIYTTTFPETTLTPTETSSSLQSTTINASTHLNNIGSSSVYETSSYPATASHGSSRHTGYPLNTTDVNTGEQSNSFTFSVIVSHEVTNTSNKTDRTFVAPGLDHTTLIYTTTKRGDEESSNSKLIIGLTIGAVLIVILIAAIVALCCFLRLKKKEKVERNYVRNTNIFYSFPEEYYVTENMSYEPAEEFEDLRTTQESHQNGSLGHHGNNSSVRMDNYKIKQPATHPSEYQNIAGNGSVVFVNGTQPDITFHTNCDDDNIDFATGNMDRDRSASSEQNYLYSEVKKEGKTKF